MRYIQFALMIAFFTLVWYGSWPLGQRDRLVRWANKQRTA